MFMQSNPTSNTMGNCHNPGPSKGREADKTDPIHYKPSRGILRITKSMGLAFSQEALTNSNTGAAVDAAESCAPPTHPHTSTAQGTEAGAGDGAGTARRFEPAADRSTAPKSHKRKAQRRQPGAAPAAKKRKTAGKGGLKRAAGAVAAARATEVETDKMPATAALPQEPVDYRDLKEWIAEQEALPQPAPLTDVQRKAIAELKASIAKKVPEPDVGGADWVSLLHSQSHLPT